MQQIRSIPVAIATRTLKQGSVKELRLLLHLKQSTNGHFFESDLQRLFETSPVKVRRTFDKQLRNLIEDKWIGHHKNTYFIRSWDKYAKTHNLNIRQRIRLDENITDINKLRAFLFAGVVGYQVACIKYFYKHTDRGQTLALRTGEAFQSVDRKGVKYQRFGISMERIAQKLGFTRHYMIHMKNAAKKFKYLICKHMFQKWEESFGSFRHRQLIDEITCCLNFCNRKTITL